MVQGTLVFRLALVTFGRLERLSKVYFVQLDVYPTHH